jgi:hypothetical protein
MTIVLIEELGVNMNCFKLFFLLFISLSTLLFSDSKKKNNVFYDALAKELIKVTNRDVLFAYNVLKGKVDDNALKEKEALDFSDAGLSGFVKESWEGLKIVCSKLPNLIILNIDKNFTSFEDRATEDRARLKNEMVKKRLASMIKACKRLKTIICKDSLGVLSDLGFKRDSYLRWQRDDNFKGDSRLCTIM